MIEIIILLINVYYISVCGCLHFAESNYEYDSTYQVDLTVNGKSTSDSRSGSLTYISPRKRSTIPGFGVMLTSSILVKMGAGIFRPSSCILDGVESLQSTQGIHSKIFGSDICNTGTWYLCISQGQFHEIILSV